MLVGKIPGVVFVTPPRLRNRVIEFSYAADWENGRVLLRVHLVLIERTGEDLLLLADREGAVPVEPWFDEPRDGAWKQVG